MKLIEASIREDKISDVSQVLDDKIGCFTVTVCTGKSIGKKNIMRARRGTETYELDYNKMAVISFVAADTVVEELISLIADAAFTGDLGDGHIISYPVDGVLNIASKRKELVSP
jgi:nitrogen regulatory protein P-II 1